MQTSTYVRTHAYMFTYVEFQDDSICKDVYKTENVDEFS